MDIPVRRGHIILAELDPVIGAELGKVRPVIVVSNDGANAAATRTQHAVITVVPLTRTVNRTGRARPYQTEITPEESGLDHISTAQAEQVRSISVRRVVRITGRLNSESLGRVEDALRVHLML